MKTFATLIFSILWRVSFSQNIGISGNGITPDTNAILDIDVSSSLSNDKKGVLIPRMTTVDRDATWPTLLGVPEGLKIYNLTKHCEEYFDGTAWVGDCNCPENQCPSGTVSLGAISVELTARPLQNFKTASHICDSLGLRLPTVSEWNTTCSSNLIPFPLIGNDWEWVDDALMENNMVVMGGGPPCDAMWTQHVVNERFFRCVCEH